MVEAFIKWLHSSFQTRILVGATDEAQEALKRFNISYLELFTPVATLTNVNYHLDLGNNVFHNINEFPLKFVDLESQKPQSPTEIIQNFDQQIRSSTFQSNVFLFNSESNVSSISAPKLTPWYTRATNYLLDSLVDVSHHEYLQQPQGSILFCFLSNRNSLQSISSHPLIMNPVTMCDVHLFCVLDSSISEQEQRHMRDSLALQYGGRLAFVTLVGEDESDDVLSHSVWSTIRSGLKTFVGRRLLPSIAESIRASVAFASKHTGGWWSRFKNRNSSIETDPSRDFFRFGQEDPEHHLRKAADLCLLLGAFDTAKDLYQQLQPMLRNKKAWFNYGGTLEVLFLIEILGTNKAHGEKWLAELNFTDVEELFQQASLHYMHFLNSLEFSFLYFIRLHLLGFAFFAAYTLEDPKYAKHRSTVYGSCLTLTDCIPNPLILALTFEQLALLEMKFGSMRRYSYFVLRAALSYEAAQLPIHAFRLHLSNAFTLALFEHTIPDFTLRYNVCDLDSIIEMVSFKLDRCDTFIRSEFNAPRVTSDVMVAWNNMKHLVCYKLFMLMVHFDKPAQLAVDIGLSALSAFTANTSTVENMCRTLEKMEFGTDLDGRYSPVSALRPEVMTDTNITRFKHSFAETELDDGECACLNVEGSPQVVAPLHKQAREFFERILYEKSTKKREARFTDFRSNRTSHGVPDYFFDYIVAVDEMFNLTIVFTNSLSTPVELTNVTLVYELVDKAMPWLPEDEIDPIADEDIDTPPLAFMLPPTTQQIIMIPVVLKKPRYLKVTGISYDFCGVSFRSRFNEAPSNPKATSAYGIGSIGSCPAPVQLGQPENDLVITAVKHLPRLAVEMNGCRHSVLHGESFDIEITLSNVSNVDMHNIHLLSDNVSSMTCLKSVTDEHQGYTISEEKMHARGEPLVDMGRLNEFDDPQLICEILKSGESRTFKTSMYAFETGRVRQHFYFVYQDITPSQPVLFRDFTIKYEYNALSVVDVVLNTLTSTHSERMLLSLMCDSSNNNVEITNVVVASRAWELSRCYSEFPFVPRNGHSTVVQLNRVPAHDHMILSDSEYFEQYKSVFLRHLHKWRLPNEHLLLQALQNCRLSPDLFAIEKEKQQGMYNKLYENKRMYPFHLNYSIFVHYNLNGFKGVIPFLDVIDLSETMPRPSIPIPKVVPISFQYTKPQPVRTFVDHPSTVALDEPIEFKVTIVNSTSGKLSFQISTTNVLDDEKAISAVVKHRSSRRYVVDGLSHVCMHVEAYSSKSTKFSVVFKGRGVFENDIVVVTCLETGTEFKYCRSIITVE
ncbi:hypothetical protein PCE1_000862 [Barthelona sp. PCE]